MTPEKALDQLAQADPSRNYYVDIRARSFVGHARTTTYIVAMRPGIGKADSEFRSDTLLANAVQAALDALKAAQQVAA